MASVLLRRPCSRIKGIRIAKFSTEKDMFDILEEDTAADLGYLQWVSETKSKLSKSKGPLWLGKNSPFPYNNSFVPKNPLTEISKSKIFEDFKSDSIKWTVRKLSEKYKVSMERIEAIIKQKELELDLAKNGSVVKPEFIETYESNMAAVDSLVEVASTSEKIDRPSDSFRPQFAMIPEGRNFSFADAKAAIANIKDYAFGKADVEGLGKPTMKKNQDIDVLDESEFETSRFKFVFVDISKKTDKGLRKILVRDTDGVLRTATPEEKLDAAKRTWNINWNKFISA